ncbi:MAG: glycerate kinase type-2 family protein [Burkholderiaceae bacterium]|jgi:hydroxypyruvate reductase
MFAPREALLESFKRALLAADPARAFANLKFKQTRGRTLVLGAGKASAHMAHALEASWPKDSLNNLSGLVLTRYGHALACNRIEVVEAAHPIPDAAGLEAARRVLALASRLGPDDHVIALISGGGSALLSLPVDGISLDDLRGLTAQMLASGAPIEAMNVVRKHLSQIQGGWLASRATSGGAQLSAYLISDVAGDDPSAIASGPCSPDPSTFEDALDIIAQWQIAAPAAVLDHLRAGARGEKPETPKSDAACFQRVSQHIIAAPSQSLAAAAAFWREQGVAVAMLGDTVTGEASQVALVMASMVREALGGRNPLFKPPIVFLSGGECTVSLAALSAESKAAHPPRGGRCSEFLLALLHALGPQSRVYALAADTDGIDGSEDNAGACFDPQSLARAQAQGLRSKDYLLAHDAFGFFQASNDLIYTGPTGTNVNDFRAILVTAPTE